MRLVHGDHMIQQIAAAAFHPSFSDSVLPGALVRSSDGGDSHGLYCYWNLQAIFSISIEDQKSRSGLEGKRFPQLLNYPVTCWMPCHVEVQDLSPVVTDHEKAVEKAKSDRGDGEEIHCCNGLAVIPKKCQPTFGQLWISRRPPHPARDRSFGYIKSKHQKFSVNMWRSPRRVLRNHAENQIADFPRHALSPNDVSTPGDRTPVQLEASAMPANDGFGNDEDELPFPVRPKSTQQNPEQLIEGWNMRPWMLSLEDGELLPQDEVFKQKLATRPKGTEKCCQK